MVTRPEGVVVVRCERTRDSVFLAWGSRTRGRMPDQAARTSPRRTRMSCGSMYFVRLRRIQSMSFSVGWGLYVRVVGSSVVPTMVLPCLPKSVLAHQKGDLFGGGP